MKVTLNHIGLVVDDVAQYASILGLLGIKKITQPEPDPLQKVLACFMAAGDQPDLHIELLEPTDDTSPVANFLKKRGGGLHHLCFEVDDIDAMTENLVKKGCQMVSPPVKCTGYDQSFKLSHTQATKISFLMMPNKLLVELLQKGR